jgi:gliding motility-associated-like protein
MMHVITQVESKPANAILNTGFYVTASNFITVVYDVITRAPEFYNPETFSLKGLNGVGTEFVLPYQKKWHNVVLTGDLNGDGLVEQPRQQFAIVATENNTLVYITPKTAIVGHPAGVTFSILLPQKGNVWVGQNVNGETQLSGNNLAGTIVSSNKPVAVTCADDSVQPPGGCYDLVGDQIVPTDVIGKEYIVLKGSLGPLEGESFGVLATENFTSVTINNGVTTTSVLLNQGDTYTYPVDQPRTYVQCSKVVYVFHLSGYGCELGGAILPPLNCAGSDAVSFVRSNPQDFVLNILCKTGTEGAFLLNGSATLVPATAFTNVPGTAGVWKSAQINYTTAEIPVGSGRLTNSLDLFSLGVINGTAVTGALYHYLSSFTRKVITKAGNDTTVCNQSNLINLNGSVTGGATSGIWSVLNGSNTIASPTNLINTYTASAADVAQGSLTFVLKSTGNCTPVNDTVKITFVQSPITTTISDLTFCKNNVGSIPITGSVLFAAGGNWLGGPGGSFGNAGNLITTYTPSPVDLANGSVNLILTSSGSLIASCPADKDTIVVTFTNPPVVYAGTNQVVCANEDVLNLVGSISGGTTTTGIWTSLGSGNFANDIAPATDYTISSQDTLVGSVQLILTSTNNGNCLAVSDAIDITIIDKPDITITTSDTICSNIVSLPLTGTVTSGYPTLWSTNGLGNITNPTATSTNYTLSILDPGIGFMNLVFSTNGGICPVTSDTLRINFIAAPIVNAGADLSFCSNELVPLNGSITGILQSGSWSSSGTGSFIPGNNFLSTTYSPSATDVSGGSVNLTLNSTPTFGCASVADIVSLNFKPTPSIAFTSSIACQGSNTTFTDLSVGNTTITNWLWQFGDNTTSAVQNPLHPYTGSGNYSVNLIATNNNGCTDTLTKTVVVAPLPIPNFTNQASCVGETVQFQDATFLASGSIATWVFNTNSAGNSSLQNPSFTFNTAGPQIITQTVTSIAGCIGVFVDTIVVLSGPVADFSVTPDPALALENVNFTDLSTGDSIQTWVWTFGDGAGDNIQNPIHAYNTGGFYQAQLEVTDRNDCKTSVTKQVNISLLPVLPLAFTPNGDGENDIFIIREGPFFSVDFKIYNNWGELIYQGTDWKEGWDGKFNNDNAPMGVYTWTFVVELISGKVVKKSGDVTLIR